MSRLILQDIAEEIKFEDLPPSWKNFDLVSFSRTKKLYDFQQEALKNSLDILWRFYDEKIDYKENEKLEVNLERKKYLFEFYKSDSNYPEGGIDYDLTKKGEGKIVKLLKEYYQVNNNKVSFENFVNRMNFWMATGSGKTLVIVKLIEILAKLIKIKEIPANDILFLSHRDDLIEHFKKYIKEINDSQSDFYIRLKSLKEWDEVRRENLSLFKNKEITVFYYRSDNLWTEQGEKLLDFKNYENFGRWYVLLDEAHKGDKEDSIRQIIYSIISRNGFLFNFSATFAEDRDFISTVFDYNLSVFIENGYGKKIYISQEKMEAFKDRTDFSENEKQKIILKVLILLTYLKKIAIKIKCQRQDLYHYPLLLTLVNSVDTEDADLKLFFKEIEKIAEGKIKEDIFKRAKEELIEMSLSGDSGRIIFPEGEKIEIDRDLIEKINFQDILENVYNSKSFGKIEVLTIPKNKQEIIFRLKTSDRPFALIKIGDISNWLKKTLKGYEVIESFDNESFFKKINKDDSDINILMGSRTFYEGWDSNRPNIILYINIGVGAHARKFVLQSVGRGVRIEPIRNERIRLKNLYFANKVEQDIFNKIKELAFQLETLFIFGTKPTALIETIKIFEEVSKSGGKIIGHYFEINEKVKKIPLFIPVYKFSQNMLIDKFDKNTQIKYYISKEDLNVVKSYLDYIKDNRVVLMNYDISPKMISFVRNTFKDEDCYYNFEDKTMIKNPALLLRKIIEHFSLKIEEFDNFEKLERGKFIVHFEKIKFFNSEKIENFLRKIEAIKQNKTEENNESPKKDEKDKNLFNEITIKYVPNHYYYPIILANYNLKIDYINHIIKEESEVKFIEKLEEYLRNENNLFDKKFEWWFFSKIDETLDNVYIPWYNPKSNRIEHFKPDFIFWLKQKESNDYYIVFIDPKGTEYAEAYRKIDGFNSIFKDKVFQHDNFRIRVFTFFWTDDRKKGPKNYVDYWQDNFNNVINDITKINKVIY
ncbi:MAG: DEAD/DEAH box helicase family protein [Patescibacteria group bacterium]|nr:DEAD/DEAH box helicase family protein [Patescibacteria group bacterium]